MWKLPNAVYLQNKDSASLCVLCLHDTDSFWSVWSYTHGKQEIKVIKFSTNFKFLFHFSLFKIVIWEPFSILFNFRHIDTGEILYGGTNHQWIEYIGSRHMNLFIKLKSSCVLKSKMGGRSKKYCLL